ncbi:hypothetical protein [Winogradskyella aurantia]|uniref:hypothetical protein n=1 Tax=Winogradskyella aurantia TaxID=1915063 RepID=UPI001F0ADEAF|nr:hypothetical protein [Winogradskyella aurantia]
MIRRLLLALLTISILSCSTRRQVEKALNSGNYNQAIANAVDKLRTNKDARRKADIIVLLKDAYDKANARDIDAISGLKASNNPEYYKRIYETYVALDLRQESIKPLLPLYVDEKEVRFKFKNYDHNIIVAKENVSDFLYEKAIALLELDDKVAIREAHSDLSYIERVNPNYEQTRALMAEAHERGIAHVIVTIENNTEQVIPRRLEDALLDFNTYGLDQFWTAYHSEISPQDSFDYAMQLQLQQINLSPEQVKEREILRERRVKDGWEYQLDRNGNVMKDSLGNDIKIDKFIEARARVFEVQQFKSSQILGQVVFLDVNNNALIKQFPIESGFIFENIYATFRGDDRALNDEDVVLTQGGPVPFPPNEQMIFDSGEDLKQQLKSIILQVRL